MVGILLLLQVMDGVDQAVLAFTAPYVRKDLGIGLELLGAAFSAAYIGTAIGAVIFGLLADTIGRRFALCLSAFAFSAGCLCTVLVHSGAELIAVRLVTGIALGGLFPVVASIIFTRVSKDLRASAVTLVSVGAAVGVSLCGPLVALIEPRFGWRSVFVIGGTVPAVLGILAVIFISTPLSAGEEANHVRPVRRAMAAWNPLAGARDLFVHGRWKMTLLVWLAFISSAVPMFFSLSWLTTLAHAAHLGRAVTSLGPAVFTLSGLVIALVISRVVDKVGILPVAVTTALGAPLFVLLGRSFGHDSVFLLACGLAGAASVSSVNLLGVVAGLLYPDALRSRGMGFAVGVMRLGAALVPGLGGVLIARGTPVNVLFTGLGIAPLVSALAVYLLWRQGRGLTGVSVAT
ncbi:MAG: MFS transporter [Pseudomonadota bacterium]|nr:MFS transporter [Pseudomonadota bacterium]